MVEFTKIEAFNLRKILLNMMKNNRIFLAHKHNILDKKLSEIPRFQKTIEGLYKNTQAEATRRIREGERKLKIKAPNLKDDQTVVKCSRYSGGLEIVGAYPLNNFLAFMPANAYELEEDIFSILHPKGKDSIAPIDLEEVNKEVREIFELIMLDLLTLKQKRDASVVITKTLFSPSQGVGMDSLKDITKDFVNNPNGLAYLFYKHEQTKKIVDHNFILFSAYFPRAVCSSWSDKSTSIHFDKRGGYGDKVLFAFVT